MFSSVTRLGQRVRWEEAGAPLLRERETLGEERREDRGKVQGQGTGRTRGLKIPFTSWEISQDRRGASVAQRRVQQEEQRETSADSPGHRVALPSLR